MSNIKDVCCKLATVSNGVLPPGWALNLSPWYGYVYWSHWHTWRGRQTYVRTDGRSWHHGYKTKFSHIDGLPYFLNYAWFQRRNTGLDKQKCVYFSCDLRVHWHRRAREPSRIIEKRLRRLFYNSRKRRKLAGTYLVNNVPRSFTFHRITSQGDHLLVNTTIGATSCIRLNQSTYVTLFQKRGWTLGKCKMMFETPKHVLKLRSVFVL